MPVGHYDMSTVRFNLGFSQYLEEDLDVRRSTIRSVSQRVPLPFRNTSSGFRGMMLHKEKMKGWTYFMYR